VFKLRDLLRSILHVIPACLAVLFAPAAGATGAQFSRDVSLTPFERLSQPLKLTHRATTPELAALEEFGIDNDTEQHVKAPPRLSRLTSAFGWIECSDKNLYCTPLRPYRCCAAPPTGPPHV
jgi:hypothetical protein